MHIYQCYNSNYVTNQNDNYKPLILLPHNFTVTERTRMVKQQTPSTPSGKNCLLTLFISDVTLDSAYAWVCKNRNHYPPNADIWDLQFHWKKERKEIKQQLLTGKYQFKPLQIITRQDKTRQDNDSTLGR